MEFVRQPVCVAFLVRDELLERSALDLRIYRLKLVLLAAYRCEFNQI